MVIVYFVCSFLLLFPVTSSRKVEISLETLNILSRPLDNMTFTCRVQSQSTHELDEDNLVWAKATSNKKFQWISKGGIVQNPYNTEERYKVETIPIGSGFAIITILNIIGARWEDSGQIGCYYGSQKHHVQLKVLKLPTKILFQSNAGSNSRLKIGEQLEATCLIDNIIPALPTITISLGTEALDGWTFIDVKNNIGCLYSSKTKKRSFKTFRKRDNILLKKRSFSYYAGPYHQKYPQISSALEKHSNSYKKFVNEKCILYETSSITAKLSKYFLTQKDDEKLLRCYVNSTKYAPEHGDLFSVEDGVLYCNKAYRLQLKYATTFNCSYSLPSRLQNRNEIFQAICYLSYNPKPHHISVWWFKNRMNEINRVFLGNQNYGVSLFEKEVNPRQSLLHFTAQGPSQTVYHLVASNEVDITTTTLQAPFRELSVQTFGFSELHKKYEDHVHEIAENSSNHPNTSLTFLLFSTILWHCVFIYIACITFYC